MSAVSGLPTWSASEYVAPEVDHAREATEEDVSHAISAFTLAAMRCARAGFDAVELHGAHGYLFSQFLSTVYNRRTDRWGGSLENRAHLLRQTVRAVRQHAPELALVVRLSPEDFGNARGLDLDESLQVARWLAEDGIDALHLSLWRVANNTTKRPDVHPTPLFREAVGDRVRIVVAGTMWTHEEAEAQLAIGADAVALGRAAIANHDWPRRVREGQAIQRPPLTPDELAAEGLSPAFVAYMRAWKGFVRDDVPLD